MATSSSRLSTFKQRAGIGQTGIPGVTISESGQIQSSRSSSSSRRGGGGGSSSAPAPVYTSALLKQSFASEAALAQAERAYRIKQAQQKQAQLQQQQQQTAIRAVGSQRQQPTTTNINQLQALDIGKSLKGQNVVAVEKQGELYAIPLSEFKPQTKYQAAEESVSAKVTKPAFAWVGSKTGYDIETGVKKAFEPIPAVKEIGTKEGGVAYTNFAENIGYADWERNVNAKLEPYKIASRQAVQGFATGYLTGLRDKPIKVAATTALFFATPKVLGVVGKTGVVTGTIAKFPKTTSFLGKGVSYGLPSLYGGSVGARVALTPGGAYEKGLTFGDISSTELTPMVTGGYLGSKFWPKWEGYLATRDRTELTAKELIPKDVLSGQTFPTAPTSKHYGLFQTQSQRIPGIKQPTMYHATGQSFWDNTLTAKPGSSEFPGLYGSYGISPNFLRLSKQSSLYGGSFFQPYQKPGVAGIIPTKFVTGTTAKPGEAFIPGIKTEVEAILPPTSTANLITDKFYFKYQGTRIPLDVFKTTTGSSTTSATTTLNKITSSYSGAGSYPVTTPSSYLAGLSLTSLPQPTTSYTPLTSTTEIKSYTPTSYTSSKPKTPIYSTSSNLSLPKYTSPQKIVSKPKTPIYSTSSNLSLPKYTSPQKIVSKPKTPIYSSPTKPILSYYSGILKKSSRKTPSYLSYPRSYLPQRSKKLPPLIFSSGKPKFPGFPKFKVFGRRFGKFKTIGITKTEKEAFSLGKKFVSSTLGATFKVEGAKARKLPGYKTKITPEAVLYIEPRGKRLKKRGLSKEVPEIQFYKQVKSKPKKKVKGGRKKKK